MPSLQKFGAVHAVVSNGANNARSLSERKLFEQDSAAALAEWRHLGAA